jgi:hypothetical protein
MCEYFKEKKDFIMFCVFHKEFEVRSNTSDFVYFGVNETFVKNIQPNVIVVLEYELEKYCPFYKKEAIWKPQPIYMYTGINYIQNMI